MSSASDTTSDLRARAKMALSGNMHQRESKFVSFITPESERCTDWVRKLHLSIAKSNAKVPGFRLFVVEEWLDTSPLLYSAVMVHTGRPEDVVLCSVLRVTSNTTPTQHKLIMDQFVHPVFPGLSSLSVDLHGGKSGDVVVCDPAVFEAQNLTLIEVVHGALTADAIANIKLGVMLRLFNCVQGRVSSLPPSSDVGERFQECYRGYLQGGKTTDSSFRSLVRRLVRRVHGALVNLFYIGAEVEISGNLSKPLLDAIAAFRGDQTHMTVGLTPESLRKMRLEVETLNRKLSKLGYATPTDPWSDFSKLQSAVQAASSAYGVLQDRLSWTAFTEALDADVGEDEDAQSSTSGSNSASKVDALHLPTVGGARTAHEMTRSFAPVAQGSPAVQRVQGPSHYGTQPLPFAVSPQRPPAIHTQSSSPIAESSPVKAPSDPVPVRSSSGATALSPRAFPGADRVAQLTASAQVLEALVTEQAQEITRSQAAFDSISDRYSSLHAKLYQCLEELNSYKLRVEELEGKYKRLHHDWSTVTDSIREYNETFGTFEGRVRRLDDHINTIYRRQRGLHLVVLFFLLQLVVWLVGLLLGLGVRVVYFFRRKPINAEQGRAIANAEVERLFKALRLPSSITDASGRKKQ